MPPTVSVVQPKQIQTLNEKSELTPEHERFLREFKRSLKPHAKEFRNFEWVLTDSFLISFLRGTRFNVENAVNTLRQYFNIRRNQYKHLFLTLKDPSSEPALRRGVVKVLKNRDEAGRLYIFLDFASWTDVRKPDVDEVVKSLILISEECCNYPLLQKEGIVFVLDGKKFGWEHFKHLSFIKVYHAANVFANAIQIRFKKLHYVNVGTIFGLSLKATRASFPKSIQQRLVIHQNGYEDFHKEMPPSKLPLSLGGQLPENVAYDINFIRKICSKGEFYKRFSNSLATS